MASRPMPRAKRRPAPVGVSSSSVSGASSDPKTLVDEDAFFIAAHPPRPPPVEEEDAVASSSTPQPTSQDPSPRKKKRRQLPEWVAQSVSSDDRLGSPAQEADAAAPMPPPRERSVSVTPPPELDEEMLEFARQAVEKVMRRSADGTVRHADKDLDLAPTSDDVSLDLNADLARYYKGPNAQQLRERAIAREREMQAQRQRRNEEAVVTELLDQDEADEAPPTTQVITIDDSSDDELAVPDESSEAPPPAEETHDTENTMSLLLRAVKGEPLPVKVRPTTKFSTILGHFVQTYASLLAPNEQQKAYLSFEGEKTTSWKTATSSR